MVKLEITVDGPPLITKRDAGKITVISEEFALQRVFDQIIHTFEPEAQARKVILEVIPTNLLMTSDANLVWEALSNLVQNAIRMSAADQTVKLQAETRMNTVVITVTDDVAEGSMDPGQAGFGLEIVRQIARMLDARFELKPNKANLIFQNASDV